jgi:hypothetical protein
LDGLKVAGFGPILDPYFWPEPARRRKPPEDFRHRKPIQPRRAAENRPPKNRAAENRPPKTARRNQKSRNSTEITNTQKDIYL